MGHLISNIFNAFVMGLINLVLLLVQLVTAPLFALVDTVFPHDNYITTILDTFNTMCTDYIFPYICYFFNLLPPIFKHTLIILFDFFVVYYTAYLVYLVLNWIFHFKKKVL